MYHPFTETISRKTLVLTAALAADAVLWLLLALYGEVSVTTALGEGVAYGALLGVAGYFYWYVNDFLRATPAKIAIALLVQLITLGITWMIVTLSGAVGAAEFARHIPLIVVYGSLCWTMLLQGYRVVQPPAGIQEEAFPTKEVSSGTRERIDRISIKEGQKIHIVKVEELLYVQAYGDYVMLFSAEGKHIKEQTMKYFEVHLPDNFVRIHRSCIVNVDHIMRVELFGKESYNVRLKNGVTLKASINGYRLLKERLAL